MISLSINGQSHSVDVEDSTPLLWVLRDTIGMTGTKYGCGIAQCGACTVHIDGVPTRSCSMPVAAVTGKQITTIEGLAAKATDLMKIIGRELDCCSTLQGIAFWHFRN